MTNHPDSRVLRQTVQRSPFTVGMVGDICEEIQDGLHGVRHYVQEGIPLLGVGNVTEEGLDLDEVNRVTPEEHARLKRSQVSKGDVLVTITGRLGTAMVYTSDEEANLSAHVARIRIKPEHNAGYLVAYFNSSVGRNFIGLNEIGSTHPHINVNRLKDVTLVIPPRPIQDAIADKMDAAYRRKRELEAEAKALLESIDGYVLGELGIELPELTEERWFAQQANEVRGGRLDSYYYLPRFTQSLTAFKESTYPLMPLEQLTTSISGGSTPLGAQYPDRGVPFLRIQNIADGVIDLSDIKYISPETHKSMRRSQLQPLDLLMTITGRVGTCAVVPKDFGDGNINQHIVRMSITAELNPYYAAEVLNSPVGRLQAERSVTGTTRIALDYPTILQIRIPVPPLGEQRDIAAEVQRRRERAAALQEEAEQVVAEAKAEVERTILGEGEA